MSDILGNNVVSIKTPNSITSGEFDNPADYISPFTFTDWLVRTNLNETDGIFLLNQYKVYLLSWYRSKNLDKEKASDFIRSSYINLLREIILSYATLEERRFVSNADLTNDLDLHAILPLFVEKIKTICNYYALLRENVKNQKYQNSLKGSTAGVVLNLKNSIIKSLNALNIIKTDTINFNLSNIRDNISVEFLDFYDDTQYFDLNPAKPETAYNPGLSSEYYAANLNEFNTTLYTDFSATVVDAIRQYPFFLNDFATPYTINVQVNANDLEYLRDKDFITQINNNDPSNLTLNLQKELIQKFIGTDYYYISTGSTASNYISSILFEAEDKAANFLNKRFPSTGGVANEKNLKDIREIGGYFLPDKLGVLNFNTLKYEVDVDQTKLEPNKIYIFPDPKKYGNISNLSLTDFDSPLIYEEDVSWMHFNRTAQYIYGNIISNPLIKNFYAYHSRNETIGYMPFGMARDIDTTEFFVGSAKEDWGNSDVFPVIKNVLPLDKRQENLLIQNKTLVKYRNDIYGNNYGLYKEINPVGVGPRGDNFGDFISQGELDFYNFTGGRAGLLGTGRRGITYNQFEEIRAQRQKPCLILDGHIFFDLQFGFNFDFTYVDPVKRYSGVTMRTVTQIPPGSGYYTGFETRGSALTSVFADPLSSYSMSYPYYPPTTYKPLPQPLLFIGYGKGHFFPDDFCDVADVSYCLLLDCLTYVDILSNLPLDFSSDQPGFNSSIPVYYNELLENSLSDAYGRPTYADAATFSYMFAASTGKIQELNAYRFNLGGQTPCEVSSNSSPSPSLDYNYDLSDFANIETDENKNTKVAELSTTLVGPRSIYQGRYETKGEFYFKNANTTRVETVTDALSSSFAKYPSDLLSDALSGIYNFDLIYNILFIETKNYFIIEKIDFNYETNEVTPFNSDRIFLTTHETNYDLEKISVPFFNELSNTIYFVRTKFINSICPTNIKIIYPELYKVNVNQCTLEQIYPNFELTYQNLSVFEHVDEHVNVERIDKPVLTFNEDSKTFVLNYFVKNPNNVFFNTLIEFQETNGGVVLRKKSIYKPDFYIEDYNFCNDYPFIPGYTLAGSLSQHVENGVMYFCASAAPTVFGNKFIKCDYGIIFAPEITPTPTPSITPPVTPTITPSITPTPTPTLPYVCYAIQVQVANAATNEVNGTYTLSGGYFLEPVSGDNTGFQVIYVNDNNPYYFLYFSDNSTMIKGSLLSAPGNFIDVTQMSFLYGSSATITDFACAPYGVYDLTGSVYDNLQNYTVTFAGNMTSQPTVSLLSGG